MTSISEHTATKLRMVTIAPSIKHQELVRYLNKKIGICIELIHCKNYHDAMTALANGEAQLGWLGRYGYQESQKWGEFEPIAVAVPKGGASATYKSLFITLADSPICTLKDVKNTRIAIGDHYSTSSYVVPKQEMRNVGIHLDNHNEFAKIVSTVNQDESVRLVQERKVDVAPISSLNFEWNIKCGQIDAKKFKVIHSSAQILVGPLLGSKSLPKSLRDELSKHILEAHLHIKVDGYSGSVAKYMDPAQSRKEYLEDHLQPQWSWQLYAGMLGMLALLVLIIHDLDIDLHDAFINGVTYILDIGQRMFPPDFTHLSTLLLAMLETIEIAILGTVLAILLSVPIGFLSARNISRNNVVYYSFRTITIFFRAIPEFIMAMILVIAIGFGALPGVLALGFHTMGFLAKFYGEAIEHVKIGPIEALESTGASRLQVIMFAIVPQIASAFVGYNLYILDRNVRMATMLGIVGAGGIGYELQSAFRMFHYREVSTIILIIFITVFIIDFVSAHIRSKILGPRA